MLRYGLTDNDEMDKTLRLLEMTQRQIDNYERRKLESNEWFFSEHYIDIKAIKDKHMNLHLRLAQIYKTAWGV